MRFAFLVVLIVGSTAMSFAAANSGVVTTTRLGEYYWVWLAPIAIALLVARRRPASRKTEMFVGTMKKENSISVDSAAATSGDVAHTALRSLHIPVLSTDSAGQITFINPSAEKLLAAPAAQITGRKASEILQLRNENTGQFVNLEGLGSADRSESGGIINGDYLLRAFDACEYRVHFVATPIMNAVDSISGYVLTLRDTSESPVKTTLSELQVDKDALTGLPNRIGFEGALNSLLQRTKHEAIWHSLCYLDLDNFKIINDTCGHAAGDALLRQLTEVLRAQVRNSDIIARLGGDEFGLLLENCPLEQAQRIGEKVRQKIAEFRFVWTDRTYAISASIGIVEISPGTATLANVLSTADVACFAAKELGRNRVHVYLESDDESARRHGEMQWYARITQAHAENRFVLYHQRIAPLGATVHSGDHYEILVRMIDEAGKTVPPGAFLPAAERYNLMPMIDRWVINETFATIKKRHGFGHPYPETVAINLSGASLGDAELLNFIKEQFESHNLPTNIVCFEITETAAITNLVHAIKFIKDLKSMNCRFSLDDFGSGLSSFTYLKNMPVDYLKIDGSFVKDMLKDSINLAMVESINQIGHVMGIKTIAEFVETKELADRLQLLGVDFAQGYGIDVPQPFLAVAV